MAYLSTLLVLIFFYLFLIELKYFDNKAFSLYKVKEIVK